MNSKIARTYCSEPSDCPRAQLAARISNFWRSEAGATALEYALMASFIAGTVAAAVFVFGASVMGLFGRVNFL